MHDVCVVGSANLDLVTSTARRPAPRETVLGTGFAEHPGGKGLNQAVAAARAGAAVAFHGAIGADAAGDTLRAVLAAEDIDVSAGRVADAPSGRALIVVDEDGENSIIVVPGANASVRIADVAPARVVLVQLEIPLPTVSAALRAGHRVGATTILNPAPAAVLPDELWPLVDVVVANDAEADALGGVDALGERVSRVVVTRGADGVEVLTPGERWHQRAFPVSVVDTTGAGDAFCGVLAARLAAGADLRAAVRAGAAAGALAATRPGAVPALPHLESVRALLAAADQ